VSRKGTDRLAALDRTKEEVAYARFWQGIVVVTDISLIGWSVSTFSSAPGLNISLAVLGVLLLTIVAIVLHRLIQRGIAKLGEL
jgi:hypothetical protein